jgi:hypothetical protein
MMAVTHQADFEDFLHEVCDVLTDRLRDGVIVETASGFQAAVGEALRETGKGSLFALDGEDHPHVFPDFALGEFGVEVKFTKHDTWRSVANSVFEGRRSQGVQYVYVVFGKAGGIPEVRFAPYGECVVHVRASHVPRFEMDLSATKSLFLTMGISYEEFSELDEVGKMLHIREYARARLKEGERLWWLGDETNADHAVPIAARLYTKISMEEKRKARAEAALLCPQIVCSSRTRQKYDDVALFLVTYRGILAHNARDLFSAGSVALRANATRGGNYLMRALKDLGPEMREAAATLPMELFEEYWEEAPEPPDRIRRWLEKADELASDWVPSEHLFLP